MLTGLQVAKRGDYDEHNNNGEHNNDGDLYAGHICPDTSCDDEAVENEWPLEIDLKADVEFFYK